MWECPNCETKNYDNRKKCVECGKKRILQTNLNQYKNRDRSKKDRQSELIEHEGVSKKWGERF
jgi:hypothetical protein